MRPIKFRAFLKEDKTICDVVRIDLFVKCALVKLKNGRHKEFGFDDIELIQFTGLCDKNGKEIYDGDIVKWIDSDGNERIDEVKFIDGGFRLCNINYTIFHYPEKEIIGNIHDNANLEQ